MSLRHFLRFNATSLAGLLVQLATLWLLIHWCALHYLVATALAVSVAVVHNFVWHWRWTWADRRLAPGLLVARFWRFAVANGTVSLAGNVLMMPLLVDGVGLAPVPANVLAVAGSGLINFWLADRVVFRPPIPPSAASRGCRKSGGSRSKGPGAVSQTRFAEVSDVQSAPVFARIVSGGCGARRRPGSGRVV